MSWSSKHPELFQSLKAFFIEYADKPSELSAFLESTDTHHYLEQFPESHRLHEKAALVLLAGTLNQGVRIPRLFQTMTYFINKYGSTLLAVPAISQADLCSDVAVLTKTAYWEIKDQIPGIIWSVGAFCREYDLPTLIADKSYGEVVTLISSQLFYMGATSESKYKAKRAYNWLALPYPVGLGCNTSVNGDELEITISENAHRFMRDAGPLKGTTKAFPTPDHRIRYFKSFYSFLSPRFPQLVEHVFYFLDESKMDTFIALSNKVEQSG